jgi:hypothetical protein
MTPGSGGREISTTILGAIRLDGPSATREEIGAGGDDEYEILRADCAGRCNGFADRISKDH